MHVFFNRCFKKIKEENKISFKYLKISRKSITHYNNLLYVFEYFDHYMNFFLKLIIKYFSFILYNIIYKYYKQIIIWLHQV